MLYPLCHLSLYRLCCVVYVYHDDFGNVLAKGLGDTYVRAIATSTYRQTEPLLDPTHFLPVMGKKKKWPISHKKGRDDGWIEF